MICGKKVERIRSLLLQNYDIFFNFIVNLLGAIAAYCMFPKKPCINVRRTVDTRLSLF